MKARRGKGKDGKGKFILKILNSVKRGGWQIHRVVFTNSLKCTSTAFQRCVRRRQRQSKVGFSGFLASCLSLICCELDDEEASSITKEGEAGKEKREGQIFSGVYVCELREMK